MGPGQFFNFVGVTERILGLRTINWILIGFVPVAGIAFDVAGKVFSNMFYPTQTQIHVEIEVKERIERARREKKCRESDNDDVAVDENQSGEAV